MSSVIFAAKLCQTVMRMSTVICKQLFVGLVVALALMRKKENFHRMIIYCKKRLFFYQINKKTMPRKKTGGININQYASLALP